MTKGAVAIATTTQITGTVQAYVPGKTITLTRADGSQATYIVTGTSTIPTDLLVGKTIELVPTAPGEMTIRTVTYVKPRQ